MALHLRSNELEPPMNSKRSEGRWNQIAGNVKRRLGKMLEGQLDLWSGKRERAKQVTEGQLRQQQSEPPK